MAKHQRPVAMVTGGATRLGRVMAVALAGHGFDIAVHYRQSELEALELVGHVDKAGGRAVALQADLSAPDQAGGLIDKATQALGPVSLLVNNASNFVDDGLGDAAGAVWQTNIAVHVMAPAMLTAAMAAQNIDGHIVNIIDQRVFNLRPRYLSYSVSKSALWTLTQLSAIELAPKIRVNAIAPGLTLEPAHNPGKPFDQLARGLTLAGRPTDPDDVARALLFLHDTRSITGQAVILDGGQHLGWRIVSN